MTLYNMISQARHDLAGARSGLRGSQRRVSRTCSRLVRMNGLGRRPQAGRSLRGVDAFAPDQMNQRYQGFTPGLA
jgi:hypothetical protein